MATQIKQIQGFRVNCKTFLPVNEIINVRYTKDDKGETLSFENGEMMLAIPLEPIKEWFGK